MNLAYAELASHELGVFVGHAPAREHGEAAVGPGHDLLEVRQGLLDGHARRTAAREHPLHAKGR